MQLEKARMNFLTGYFSTHERRNKTRYAYGSDLSQFQEFLGRQFDILSLESKEIERWAAHLKFKGYSPASIRRKLIVLKVFCNYWVRHGLLSHTPFLRVRVNLGRIVQLPRTLAEHEIRGLLLQAQQRHVQISTELGSVGLDRPSARDFLTLRNCALLELLFATGLRVGEISAIDLDDFASYQASIKVNGKGGRERMAFVVDDATLAIQLKYLSVRRRFKSESPAYFLNASGNRLSAQGIANVVHRLRKECGINRNITPHMFRHTVATLLLRNGADIRVVQEFLGHASIATTQRYTHVAKEHLIRELQTRHPSFSIRSGDQQLSQINCG